MERGGGVRDDGGGAGAGEREGGVPAGGGAGAAGAARGGAEGPAEGSGAGADEQGRQARVRGGARAGGGAAVGGQAAAVRGAAAGALQRRGGGARAAAGRGGGGGGGQAAAARRGERGARPEGRGAGVVRGVVQGGGRGEAQGGGRGEAGARARGARARRAAEARAPRGGERGRRRRRRRRPRGVPRLQGPRRRPEDLVLHARPRRRDARPPRQGAHGTDEARRSPRAHRRRGLRLRLERRRHHLRGATSDQVGHRRAQATPHGRRDEDRGLRPAGLGRQEARGRGLHRRLPPRPQVHLRVPLPARVRGQDGRQDLQGDRRHTRPILHRPRRRLRAARPPPTHLRPPPQRPPRLSRRHQRRYQRICPRVQVPQPPLTHRPSRAFSRSSRDLGPSTTASPPALLLLLLLLLSHPPLPFLLSPPPPSASSGVSGRRASKTRAISLPCSPPTRPLPIYLHHPAPRRLRAPGHLQAIQGPHRHL
mmetsp:Transcript_8943/g.28396  ORF Transcript_8943/g.28396 Transcript_8943/m.28396 type:complete len:480 (-) Transcript_8943:12-1451(-)